MADAKNPAESFNVQSEPGITKLKTSFISRHKGALNIVIVALILFLLLAGLVYFYVQGQLSAILSAPSSAPTGRITGTLTLLQQGLLTYNYSSYLLGYAKAHYSQSNSSNSTLSLSIYPENPSEPVYVINVGGYCDQCFVGSSLFGALNYSMSKYGMILNRSSLNYIDINQLSRLPQKVTVIIPSGLLPNILLPNATYTEKCTNYANITIMDMLGEGDTVIYVGRNFSRSVSCSGQVTQNTAQETAALNRFSNNTIPNTTSAGLFFSSPTFIVEPGASLGHVYSAHILNGTLIVLSDYPSTGWNNSVSNLASDLAKVMVSRFWIPAMASGFDAINGTSSNATVFTTNTLIGYSSNVSAQINSSYALLRLNLTNQDGFQDFELPFRYSLKQNGLISMPAVTGLSQATTLSAQVFNQSKSSTVITFVSVLDRNLSATSSAPILVGQTGAQSIYSFPQFYLPTGYYVAQLIDQQGSIYSSSLFYIANSTIIPQKLNFSNVTFLFSASSNGQPLNGVPYQISINKAYGFNGIIENGNIKYSLPPGTSLNRGNGTFEVGIMGSNYSVPYNYQSQKAITVPPLYIAFAVAAIGIVILNKILVPPNIDDYYIDVPDIKPSKLEHAKEPAESIVSVFDKVNAFYHWKYVPLTADEVKSGISTNIKYGNTRMTITLRNTYAILGSMVEKGVVSTADDYYAPSRWISESGYSMEYLVIYRKLKDYCISNAMLLTEMGASSKADVIVTNKGAQNYVKIYSPGLKAKDIEVSQKTRTFIVFIDEEARMSFLDKLYLSYGNNAEILKMAISYGNVRLVDSNNLSDLKL